MTDRKWLQWEIDHIRDHMDQTPSQLRKTLPHRTMKAIYCKKKDISLGRRLTEVAVYGGRQPTILPPSQKLSNEAITKLYRDRRYEDYALKPTVQQAVLMVAV